MVPGNGNSTIRFSIFELDLRAGELRRNGSRIRLQEQPFQILVSLLEHPGEVVTRDELRHRLWSADTYVDFDHGLNAAIRRLRDALGDSADTPRFVETVARRGYRFIAPTVQAPKTAVESAEIIQPAGLPPGSVPSVPRENVAPFVSDHGRRIWQAGIAAGAVLIVGIFIGLHLGNHFSPHSLLSQRRLTANSAEVPVISAALSPSGKFLAFADTTGVYLRQVDGGETHPIALPAGFAARPVSWFPDDTHLLVTTPPGSRTTAALWRVSVLGGDPQLLIGNASSAVASPNGKQIAFVRGIGVAQGIWVMQADGEGPVNLFSCDGCLLGGLAWSPDSALLAYARQQYQIGSLWSFDTQLEILDLASKRSQVIERHVGLALAWTRDGRIIYCSPESPPNQRDSNLWAVPINARTLRLQGPPERLTSGNGLISAISTSADGRKLAITRYTLQPDVYIAQLEDQGTRLSKPRLLTFDERQDFPTAWTPDSKAVLFFSDRDGVFHIFKQAIDQAEPELLVGGDEPVGIPRLSADGSMVIYVSSPLSDILHPGNAVGTQRLMRVPVTGGPPQLVLEGRGIVNLQCARSPSTLCLYSELRPGEERFYTFDPLKGKGQEIPSAAIHDGDFYSYNWSLSPDGKMLARSKKMGIQDQPAIRLFSLADAKENLIPLPGWAGLITLDWAADGKSVWATAFTASSSSSTLWTTGFNPTGSWTLLKVDLSGKITPMLQESKMILGWAIPSPDDSRLALWMAQGSSNVWLVESH